MASILTPLQLIAGSGLLQNQGLEVSPALTDSITAYENTALITAFNNAVSAGAGIIGIGASTCPAFSDSVPTAYANLGNVMTTVIQTQANDDFGPNDISKFVQAINLAQSYAEASNLFVNSAVNSQTYLGNTFTTTNDMITADITTVNLATQAWGNDLIKLGRLINLDDLNNLGSPLALVQQIIRATGNLPVLSVYFLNEGISQDVVFSLNNPNAAVSDSVQRLMYQAMTKITGDDLNQVLQVLAVTTEGIETMADLLNPVKLFPNSFQSLTAPTANGPRAIYVNSTGSVNTSLAVELPAYVVSTVA